MKEYVQTGDFDFDVAEVSTPVDYADSDDTAQKLSKTKSVIDVFANRVFESKKEDTPTYSKRFQDSMQQFEPLLEVGRYYECKSTRCSCLI